MDSFVSEKLHEWNLSSWKNVFEENLIDEEAFMLLDNETVKEIITPVGPRMKFLANLKKLKGDQLPLMANNAPVLSIDGFTVPGPSDVFPTSPASSQSSQDWDSSDGSPLPPQKKFKSDFNVRSLLKENSPVGESIIAEIEEGEFCRKSRMAFVRMSLHT